MARPKKHIDGGEEKSIIDFPNKEHLVAVLEQYPHVHTVFVNEEGEYFFQERPGYTAYTREDILNG